MIKNKLAHLAKIEGYIARFQLLSNINERALTEHNDQLDFTWKDGYETGVRDANATHQAIESKPVEASLGFTVYSGHIVENWRDSWKWISNWCFGLIVFFATTPIPPELLMVLPENVRIYLIAFTAFCGFVGRYLNQTKPLPLPPIHIGDADV